MKNFTTFLIWVLFAQIILAQTTRVQVIHNSADAVADTVDVYLNNAILIDNFAFRNASSFINAPAGSEISIDIAPKNSSSASESIHNFKATLSADKTYILVASGIVSNSGYNPTKPFAIDVFEMGKESASTGTNTDLLVYHGSTDAPTVDVYEATGNTNLVDNIAYKGFASDYLELATSDYYLQVRNEAGNSNIFAYNAPLKTLALDGGAAVVVASGFVDPSNNSDGPGFGLFVALPGGGEMVALPKTTARVQVIHNSADAAADSVDVYLNDEILIDNFAFRNASGFIDAPANTEISIDIAPKSSSSSDESIYNLATTLDPEKAYTLVASGIVSTTGYAPLKAFAIDVFDMSREKAGDAANTDLLVYHGSTDAPTVDVYEATGNANLVDNIAYKGFDSDYLELATSDYYLQVRNEAGNSNIFAYNAPLKTLALDGGAAVVVASGFVDPSNNSDGPGFGLFVALPGGGEMVALPKTTARVQVIHNSADAAADSVDVYLNDEILIDNFAFRNASGFIDAPANTEISIDIAPKSSSSSDESIYNLATTLDPEKAYTLVASGIVSTTGYAPLKAFAIDVFDMSREKAGDAANTDLLVYHGSTDAPTVDVYEATGNANLVDNIAYKGFDSDYLELATSDYYLQVRNEAGNSNIFAYNAPLKTLALDGGAAVVVASGFVDPSNNSDGPGFGLFVALPGGGEMVALPKTTARVQVIHNSADAAADSVDVYLNDEILIDNFAFRNASGFIDAPANTEISIDIAPKSSSSSDESIYNLATTLDPEKAYTLVASGIVSTTGYAPLKAFAIDVFDMSREKAGDAANTDLLVYHGSTDAPTVDVYEATGNANLVDNIAYKGFDSDYLELATSDYYLQVRNEAGNSNIFAYNAPLKTLALDGGAAVVVASGFVDPSNNSDGPGFGLFVALPGGGEMVALPKTTARVQVIHNSADAAADSVDVYLNDEILIDNFAFRNASGFIDAPANTEISIDIAPKSSSSSDESIYNLATTLDPEKAYTLVASGIVSATGYAPLKAFAIDVFDMSREKAGDAANTDLLVYHGSTDAPTVDVYEASGPSELIDNLEYSKFADYLELSTADYIIEVRDETGTSSVNKYEAPLNTLDLKGEAIAVVASGFLDPSSNSNGASFGLWVALQKGGEMIELPVNNASSSDSKINDISSGKFFPNPTYGSAIIELNKRLENAYIEIMSLTGTIIYGETINVYGSTINISLDSLKPGSYFIKITSDDYSETIRFQKL